MTNDTGMPSVIDRDAWLAEIEALRVREKEHTRAGDAIAAARRRLPMTEVPATAPLIGQNGRVTLLDAFEGRRQLIAYFHMWHTGHPAAEQCEGCTFFNGQVRELSYLHARDTTYATLCQGPYEQSVRYRDFMGWDVPWYSCEESAEVLIGGRAPFVLACYLRDGDKVFETYWTTYRGVEVMSDVQAARSDRLGAAGAVGGLAAGVAADHRRLLEDRRPADRAVAAATGWALRRSDRRQVTRCRVS